MLAPHGTEQPPTDEERAGCARARSPRSGVQKGRGLTRRVRPRPLGGVDEIVAGNRDDLCELVLQVGQSVPLDLADALAADLQLTADLLQRGRLAVEAEAKLQYSTLALRQTPDRLGHRPGAYRLGCLGLRVGGGRIGEQTAELALPVGADRLVQRHRRLDGAERLLDITQLQTGRLGQLLQCRLLAARCLEALTGTVELHAPLVDVCRNADRRRLDRDRTLAGLAHPPGGVGRELEAL